MFNLSLLLRKFCRMIVLEVKKINDLENANLEGLKFTSPVATVYFVFLFGTFGMLIVSSTYSRK